MLRCIQNSCDARFKLFIALLNSSGVWNLLFAFFRISSSKYSLSLIIPDIILGFGETIASPCSRFLNFVSLMDPYGSSFQKQHISRRLVFLQFLICIKIKIIAGFVYPGITQITLHCPVFFCYSPITYQTRKLYYHKTLLNKNL